MADDPIISIEQQTTITAQKNVVEVVALSQQESANVVSIESPDSIIVDGGNESVVAVDGDPQIVIVSSSEQGVPGRDGVNGNQAIEMSFAFGDASPAIITTAEAGKLVYLASIHISEPFDGIGASLSIGDALMPNQLMGVTENDPTQVGSSEVSPAYSYVTDTQIILSITAGAGASKGAGLVTLSIQQ